MLLALVLAVLSSIASAASSQAPTPGGFYKDGPSGRYLLGGTWLYRADDGVGLQDRFEDSHSTSGWTPVSVPNAWNAGQQTAASYQPSAGWYRRDFTLPSSSPSDTWIVRFESVNNTATIWLNGHRLASHTGAFLPFEVQLPRADLAPTAVNRLVVRVSDAHSLNGLPPLTRSGPGGVVGGWWNYGGLLREVYLRRVVGVDFASVQVLPHLSCATCAATISYSVVMNNVAASAQRVALRTSYGGTVAALGTRVIAAGATATFTGQLRIAKPVLWSPSSPHLYDVTIDAAAGSSGAAALHDVAHYFLESGIRAVTVSGGRLYLNYQPLDVRGVGLIEDSQTQGSALTAAQQLALMERAKALGATMIRSQYPLSAYEEQLADELGIMLWSEIPAYQVPDTRLRAVTPLAVALTRENILDNGNHPSIAVWSVGNELSPLVGAAQTAYIAATVAAAHALDPTRPVGMAFQGYPSIGCQAGYGPLDVLGINDYFGWYPGPNGQIADETVLTDYLNQERACYPKQALMVTEFGAEANRDGPVDERGTYEFQSQFVATQLAQLNATPWLSGAIYWALQDFLVRPGWTGGNPYPTPPVFHKGLLDLTGAPKPAYAVAQQAFAATTQIG
ncbi:MAG: glycoside hydrolase family 2 protein [Solirubrobacteraceae bacterium]